MTAPPALTIDEQRAALHQLIEQAGDVERLHLGPRDWLVLKFTDPTEKAGALDQAARLADHLDIDRGRIIVVHPGADLAVLQHSGGVNTRHPNDRHPTEPAGPR